MTPPDASTADAVPLRAWLAVVVVAVGTFTLITAEQLPIGVLTEISVALGVSEGVAALTITAPGVVAGFASALLPIGVGRLDRRVVLAGLIALLAVASVGSALATSFELLLASRVLVGVSIGGFWAIAGGLAVRLVPPRLVPRATTIIFGGIGAASVLGVPVGTFIGELGDWRAAFLSLAGLSVVVLAGLLLLVPPLPQARALRPAELMRTLRDDDVRTGVVAAGLIVTSHYAAFTFVSPILQEISGLGRVSALLLGFGIAGLIGNAVAGTLAGRDARRCLLGTALAMAGTLALFPLAGTTPLGGTVLVLVWGLLYGGVSVTLQTWMLQAAPDAPEAATALMSSVFNLAIAGGALVGGLVVDGIALSGVLWLGVAFALATAWTARPSRGAARRDPQFAD